MAKPVVIVDAHWRQMGELFSDSDLKRLHREFEVVWGEDAPIPPGLLQESLPQAFALVSAQPVVGHTILERSPELRVVAEVSGSFPSTIDYAACHARGVEVLSCAPGFRQSVAELAVAMILAGARGLVQEHELFRAGGEHWLADNSDSDFSLFGQKIGFVGYGSIAQEVHRLLQPFQPDVSTYDPWLRRESAAFAGVQFSDLLDVMRHNRCVIVAAAPSRENKGLIDAQALSLLPDGALFVLISRAHLVDFPALVAEAASGRIRVAMDVYPAEPLAKGDAVRQLRNVILSPHRAAAVEGGRHPIGSMLLADLMAVKNGVRPTALQNSKSLRVNSVAGIGDANQPV